VIVPNHAPLLAMAVTDARCSAQARGVDRAPHVEVDRIEFAALLAVRPVGREARRDSPYLVAHRLGIHGHAATLTSFCGLSGAGTRQPWLRTRTH
jgi:hypothetical protein